MKKISTLVFASLLTMAAFAADRRPSVTVQASKEYEIVIDGKSYFSSNYGTMNIANLREGRHTITVYKLSQGVFFKRNKRMTSTSAFAVNGKDINIKVDMFGKLQITETKYGKDQRNGGGWDDRNDSRGNDRNNGNRGNDSRSGNRF